MPIQSSSIYKHLGLQPRTILNGAPIVKSFLGPKEEEEESRSEAQSTPAPEVKPKKSKRKRREKKVLLFKVD